MDRLMEILGAESLPWSYKTDCCGASLVMTRTDIVQETEPAAPLHGRGGRGGLHRDRLLHVSGKSGYAAGGNKERGRGKV